MNYYDIVNVLSCGKRIYDLPLKVTFYCRVSTDSDVQLNSLDNQLDYYKNLIKENKNWNYIEGYIEEGVTGTRADKRCSFMKMIKDAQLGKFNLIITKDVSRFARDLEDSIHYIRELKNCGVGVFFENQNLSTFDSNAELVLNMFFNFAQEYSRNLSKSIKFGHKKAIDKGHVLGSSNIIGFKKDNCKLKIVEEQAKMVRKTFELYATGEYGFTKLGKKLADLGYLNKNGNIYSKCTLERIIQNPKYKGFYRAGMFEIIDYRSKERKKNKIEDQIIYKTKEEIIPSIVSEELWEKANEVYTVRAKSYKNNNHWSGGLKYPFSSKMYCKEHKTNFQRSHGRRGKNRPTWSCGMYLQYRLAACESPIIAEKDLYNIFSNIMSTIIPQKSMLIKNMLDLYNNIDKSNEYDDELASIESDIQAVENEKRNTIRLVTKGIISDADVETQFENFRKELERLLIKKTGILKQIEILKHTNTNVDKISKAIEEEMNGGSLENFIRKFVDEIIVSKIDGDRYNIKLDIFLNLLGDEKYKTKVIRHIDGPTEEDILYLENQVCETIEKLRADRTENKFTYNVYVKTLQ